MLTHGFSALSVERGTTEPGRLSSPWGARGDSMASLLPALGVRWQVQRQAAAAWGRQESRNRFPFIGREGAQRPGGDKPAAG